MSALEAYGLRTENMTEPRGVDSVHPRFSWRLRSTENGQAQTAYRIAVHAVGATGESAGVWDSGWVLSASTFGIPYEGPLRGRTRYRWVLQVRDVAGSETAPAESVFETALLDHAEFEGGWIRRNPLKDWDFDPPVRDDVSAKVRHIPPAPYLRRSFPVDGEVARARLRVSARGLYRAYLNGERVGDTELAPGWTDYRDRIQYQTFDVTDDIRAGDNVIGAVLGEGWWAGYVGFDSRRQGNHYGLAPELWAQLDIDYRDGRHEVVASDGRWREHPGEIVYNDLLMGEKVDRRRDLGDWTFAEYDASAWVPVLYRELGDELVAEPDEPMRVTRELRAERTMLDPDGRRIYDFGQNLVGRVSIELGPMREGQVARLRHAEILDDGRLYTTNLRTAEATDIYISAGGDSNRFEPVFTLHGFRYVEVTGVDELPLEAVVAQVIHNDTAWTGSITTSSPDLNQLVSNVEWGQRSNFVAIPTDCPQRDERLGWTADAQVFLPTAAFNADVQAFMARWMRDVRFSQLENGSIPDVVPVVSDWFGEGAPVWADAITVIPWTLYRSYGDVRVLAESFDSMRRFVDFVDAENPDHLWRRHVGGNMGDWLEVGSNSSRSVIATAYFANSATLTAAAARRLGDGSAERYEELAAGIRAAFRAEYVDSGLRIESDTQTCYLLALAFDLVPDAERAAIGDHLVRTIEDNGRLLTTGFVGVSHLAPVLTSIGRTDLAYALLETDRYPSWLYSIRQGATTIWERWDGWTEHAGFQAPEMNSFNHYSLGSVLEWMYRHMLGIDQTPDSVGFGVVRYAPQLGGTVTSADGRFESPRGRIASSWRREGEGAVFDLELPPGVIAHVTLPVDERAGRPRTADDLEWHVDNGRAQAIVGAGRHRFTVADVGSLTPEGARAIAR